MHEPYGNLPTPRIDALLKEIRNELLRHAADIEGSTGLQAVDLKARFKENGQLFRVVFNAQSEHHCDRS
jgi:hypothetical protein